MCGAREADRFTAPSEGHKTVCLRMRRREKEREIIKKTDAAHSSEIF